MQFPPINLNETYLMERIGRLTVNLGAAYEQIDARDRAITELERQLSDALDEIDALKAAVDSLSEDDDEDES